MIFQGLFPKKKRDENKTIANLQRQTAYLSQNFNADF
jgi:hypothetical protein